MRESLTPPVAASRILSCFADPHLPQILGDLMEEFSERAQSSGVPAARLWYWREVLRNLIAMAGRSAMSGKGRPKSVFVISGTWFSIALLLTWLSRGWLAGMRHQAWGLLTAVVFGVYFALVIGWLIPLLWALAVSLRQREHLR